LVVDEAHALGVIGPNGAGLCAQAGLHADILIGGLGKAFGLAGGFAAGSAVFARAIDNFARTFVFSTAILPAIAHAVPTAVALVREADSARAQLQQAATSLRVAAGRRAAGAAPGVIVPVLLGAPELAMRAQARLRDLGLMVPAMRPPTVPAGTARLRITPTALHSPGEIGALAEALRTELG
jgi:7-keto-8-aminopelargonate synthetase-like enzyme